MPIYNPITQGGGFFDFELQGGAKIVKKIAPYNASEGVKGSADYVCEGQDDQKTIQKVLDKTSKQNEVEIQLFNGTYIFSAPLEVRKNTKIRGEGENTIIKIKDNLNADIQLIQNKDLGSGSDGNIIIENLKLDGNKSNQTQPGGENVIHQIGIYFGLVKMSKIRNVWIENFLNEGIYLLGNAGITIENVQVKNNKGTGILIKESPSIELKNSVIQQNGKSGIYLFNVSNSLIEGNQVIGNKQFGIYLFSTKKKEIATQEDFVHQTTQTDLLDNVCRSNFIGLGISNSRDNFVGQGNYNENDVGIVLFNSDENELLGIECKLNKKHGLRIIGGQKNLIEQADIRENSQQEDNKYSGILIRTSNQNEIWDVVIRKGSGSYQQKYGIELWGPSGAEPDGNKIMDSDLEYAGKTANWYNGGTNTINSNNLGI